MPAPRAAATVPTSCAAAVLGVVRVYLEPDTRLPEAQRPADWPVMIDYGPDEVRAAIKRWRRKGFTVLAMPL